MTRSGMIALLLLLAAFTGAGCQSLLHGIDGDLHAAEQLADEKKYAEALAGYQALLSRKGRSGRDAEARYSIAVILATHDNPQKSYPRALEAFSDFLRKYPDHERAKDAANWAGALKVLQEAKQENEQLRKNIEELKRLDVRQEKRRSRQ